MKPSDFLTRLSSWIHHGFVDADGRQIKRAMGIGQTVFNVVSAADDPRVTSRMAPSRHVWEQSGQTLAANGAVMRTAITGVPHYSDRDAVIDDTVDFARATHCDPRAVASCIAVAVLVSAILQRVAAVDDSSSGSGGGDAAATASPLSVFDLPAMIDDAVDAATRWLTAEEESGTVSTHAAAAAPGTSQGSWTGFSFDAARRELAEHVHAESLSALALDHHATIGYTYKCLGSAFVCLRSLIAAGAGAASPTVSAAVAPSDAAAGAPPFVAAICDLVAEGGDADTNAAVAGALMGCFLGYDEVVAQVSGLGWEQLNHRDDILEPRLAQLRTAMGLDEPTA